MADPAAGTGDDEPGQQQRRARARREDDEVLDRDRAHGHDDEEHDPHSRAEDHEPHVHAPEEHGPRAQAEADEAHEHDRPRGDRGGHGHHGHDHGDDHEHAHGHGHGHSHGLVHESIKRSREGLRAVGLALLVLGATAIAQLLVFVASGSVALLADLIHNFGDAATAIPLAIAFALRSARAERIAGLAVVLAIFVSACVAGYEAIDRLIDPHEPTHLTALALAGVVGFAGNWWAATIRTRAGRRLDSPALVADGAHARADAYVSLAVVASAIAVAIGLAVADPLIGLGITIVILKITRDSWVTVRAAHV